MRRGDSNGVGCLDHSVCPNVPVPATVLVPIMNDGSYLLIGYPHGGPSLRHRQGRGAAAAGARRGVRQRATSKQQGRKSVQRPHAWDGDAAVIRDDRELLTELARLNRDMASLALRIMDESASVAEQRHYAQRLIAVGERLQRRADGMRETVIDGEVVAGPALSAYTVELDRES